jgi:hypothetical protein
MLKLRVTYKSVALRHEASRTLKPPRISSEATGTMDNPFSPTSCGDGEVARMSYPDPAFGYIPCNRESLFSTLRMFRRRAVCETKLPDGTVFIEHVDDTACIQRIEPEVTYRNPNVGSNLYRSHRRVEAHPRHAEHSPCANRLHCSDPRDLATPQPSLGVAP